MGDCFICLLIVSQIHIYLGRRLCKLSHVDLKVCFFKKNSIITLNLNIISIDFSMENQICTKPPARKHRGLYNTTKIKAILPIFNQIQVILLHALTSDLCFHP